MDLEKKMKTFVDLTKYGDCRFVRKKEEPLWDTSELEGVFLDKTLLQEGKIVCEEFEFALPGGGKDLLSFNGQEIDVSGGEFEFLDLAGFCVFGQFWDYVTLCYANGTEKKKKVFFLDISLQEDETITVAKEIKRYYKLGKRVFQFYSSVLGCNLYIFAHRISLDKNLILKRIRLAKNPFMYLCGMTLWGRDGCL